MKKKALYLLAGAAAVAIAIFAYYTISPLFITITANEEVPGTTSQEVSPGAPVIGTPGHPASGFVRVVEADTKKYIRYENFKTINGPDIYVYLSKDIDAKEFVSLGRVKATEGNVNYEIPSTVEINEYPFVLVWCKAFGVLFNYANLAEAN